MLKNLKDEGILFLDLPHFIEQVGGWSASAIGATASDGSRDMRRDAIRQRQLNVTWKIPQRPQLENIKRRFVFVIRMRWRIEPGMADVVTQGEDKCFSSLSYHCRLEGISFELRDEVRKHRLEQRTAGAILRNDVFVNLSDDGADNVFCRFVLIANPSQHLQVANHQRFLYVVGRLSVFQIWIRPDIDRANFIWLRSNVTTAEDSN